MRFFVFISLILLIGTTAFSETGTIYLKFADLPGYLETGPAGRLVLSQRDAKVAAAKSTLQWTNPELEAEHENLSGDLVNETETIFALSKTFMSPWTGAAHRKARNYEMEANEHQRRQHHMTLMAEWKYRYVDIRIMSKLQQRLDLFQKRIQEVSDISADRRKQGTVSGLEDLLLQMSVFNIKAMMIHLNSEIRQSRNVFKSQLGIPPDQELILDSPVSFVKVDLASIKLDEAIMTSPHLNSLQKRVASAEKKITVEKGNLLPQFSLTGGYKQVNDDLKGGLVGLSFPLPLLSLNRASIRQAHADLTTVSIEYDLAKAELMNRIRESSLLIEESQALLDEYGDMFQTSTVMNDLVFSFKEGWITLTDLFSSIEVYANAIDSYYTHMLHYYENIFQLEAKTGEELVHFD